MPESERPLELRPVDPATSGVLRPLQLSPGDRTLILGRSESADWSIPDPAVSRTHAKLRLKGGEFFLSDLGSRHGTHVNGVTLRGDEEVRLVKGDEIAFGAWRCMLDGGRAVTSMHTIVDQSDRIRRLEQSSFAGLAQVKLDRLLVATKALSGTSSREEVGEALVGAVSALRGCGRSRVIRQIGETEFEVLASSAEVDDLGLSNSLVQEAKSGQIAQLLAGANPDTRSHSIIEMDVQTALCAPVMVSGRADCFLYIDSRGTEDRIERDASSFCHAITGVAGLAIERILSAEMEERRRQIEADLKAARHAQRLLFPPRTKRDGRIEYVFESIPGRFVGGDLFDFVTTDSGASAFFLGDVTGKGAGAGMQMVGTQTQLRTLLARGVPLADAIRDTNTGLLSRSDLGQFITLVAGLFDPDASTLELCDAGHGFVLLKDEGADWRWLKIEGSVPLGVDENATYSGVRVELSGAARLVLLSDGVVEQADPSGEQFGMARAEAVLARSSGCEEDVSLLVAAVRDFAQGAFSDDLTVASICIDA